MAIILVKTKHPVAMMIYLYIYFFMYHPEKYNNKKCLLSLISNMNMKDNIDHKRIAKRELEVIDRGWEESPVLVMHYYVCASGKIYFWEEKCHLKYNKLEMLLCKKVVL